jgi:molecular chaperone DnaK
MSRLKIDYGIDLGTTNSAVSRIESGEAVVKKSDTLKDTMPSCLAINKKKAFQMGDSAYNALKRAKLNALKATNESGGNVFNEFKRTMGSDAAYHSEYLGRDLNSEELSAEILKTLKSFVKDEEFKSVVITIPAAFKNNQIDATRRAAELAGFSHVEMLQEPVAAATGFALGQNRKDGFWLVFDFGGGTFDSALLNVEEGIVKVIDTEGDNYLGGKDLDFAILDGIIMPHLRENFELANTLSNETTLQNLREALKFFAEDIKIQMSFKDNYNLLTDLGVIQLEDDDGVELEIDIDITQPDMERVLHPLFQKAIDMCLHLLERNNLTSDNLEYFVLVGGPTMSPVLRKMLTEQIMKPDTSVDPMTIVSTGAALYASTVNVSEAVWEESRDKSKLQLELAFEPTTVEDEEWVAIKLLPEKCEGIIPNTVYVELERGDKAWSSGRQEITVTGDLIETQLLSKQTNAFSVLVYDEKGNRVECEPNSFSIIQGSVIGSATLPSTFGIELKQRSTGKITFAIVIGLERNKPLPAKGIMNALKTQKPIRPGMAQDFIKIPLYQGDHGAHGTRAIYNNHIYDLLITGAQLPSLLPENSDVDLTVNVDRSQNVTVSAYFPYLDHTVELPVAKGVKESVSSEYLDNEIRKALGMIQELRESGQHQNDTRLDAVSDEIVEIDHNFKVNKRDTDTRNQTLSNLRKSLKKLDAISDEKEWPTLEKEIREELARLEVIQVELGNEKTQPLVTDMKTKATAVFAGKDVKLGNILLGQINTLFFQMTMIYQLMNFVEQHDQQFAIYSWKDTGRARTLIDQAKGVIVREPSVEQLHPIIISIIALLPEHQQPGDDDTILTR